MKKLIFIGVLILLTSITTESYSQKRDKPLKNGFHANLFIGIPSASYGYPFELSPIPSEFQFGIVEGLQVGSRWYFAPQKKFGFGLLVNWADISVSYRKIESERIVAGDVSLCALGPIGTYALSKEMAVDLYYNLRPTILATAYYDPAYPDDGLAFMGFGTSHSFGTAFRWKVLNVGLEYVLGYIKCNNLDTHASSTFFDSDYISLNNFRIKVGVKL